MTQNFNLNQFSQKTIKGTLAKGVNFSSLPAKIYASSTNTFYGATAVKIVNTSEKVIVVDKAAAGDQILGFMRFDLKQNTKTAGDIIDVVYSNAIMNMEAGAAINAGAKLEIVASGDKVITSAGTNKIIGIALTSASASGDLIEVLILSPLVAQV